MDLEKMDLIFDIGGIVLLIILYLLITPVLLLRILELFDKEDWSIYKFIQKFAKLISEPLAKFLYEFSPIIGLIIAMLLLYKLSEWLQ